METATAAGPVVLVDIDDLHAADADLLLADALEHGIGPVALAAHLLRPPRPTSWPDRRAGAVP